MSERTAVDGYVAAKIPPPLREIAAAARDLIRENAPDATEAIKWGHPVWEQGGIVAMLRGAKAYVTVGFALDPGYHDAHGLLEGTSATMRHVKLTSFDEGERTALHDYIHAATRVAKTH